MEEFNGVKPDSTARSLGSPKRSIGPSTSACSPYSGSIQRLQYCKYPDRKMMRALQLSEHENQSPRATELPLSTKQLPRLSVSLWIPVICVVFCATCVTQLVVWEVHEWHRWSCYIGYSSIIDGQEKIVRIRFSPSSIKVKLLMLIKFIVC